MSVRDGAQREGGLRFPYANERVDAQQPGPGGGSLQGREGVRTTRKAFLLFPTLEGNGSLTLFSAPFPRARNSPPLSVLRSATAKVRRRKGGPFGAHEGGKKEAQFFSPSRSPLLLFP